MRHITTLERVSSPSRSTADNDSARREAKIQELIRAYEPFVRPDSRCRAERVWCVELRRKFESMHEAAAFVGRAQGNIRYAMRDGGKCGGYHWRRFDPYKHRERKNNGTT